jgi:uncharacterized protein YutE (UPF0331/DUF86 family)
LKPNELVRKDHVIEYLDRNVPRPAYGGIGGELHNIQKQIDDIRSIPVSSKDCFLDKKNSIQIKPIKYSLAYAIQDILRISVHIASALSLWKVRESEAEAILALSEAKIIPKEFAEKIKGMPAFRNRIIHDYLPNEFDAARLFESLPSYAESHGSLDRG